MSRMAPLHEEHQELFPEIIALRETADAVGMATPVELRARLSANVGFLTSHLAPHAAAEDAVLYPVVARVMGAPDATATMRRDHEEVARLTEELSDLSERLDTEGELDDELARSVRRVLYGLFTLIGVHFAKEEEVYVPLLERSLDDEEARVLIRDMGAEAQARRPEHVSH